MNLSVILIRNGLFGVGARLITLLVGLTITAYLLDHLGPERFGIWALLGVVTGLVGLGDFSFKTALIKHLAGAWARGDHRAIRTITSTGFLFCIINAVALGALVWYNAEMILDLLRIPLSLRSEAKTTFLIGAAAHLSTIALAIFPALCDARQRLDITNSLGIVSLIIGAVLTVTAVEGGAGLPGVALAQLAATVFFFLATVIAARRLFGRLHLSPRAVHISTLRTLMRFGLTLHLSTICGIFNRQFDKFLLSRWAGLGWVASYELAYKWIGNVGSLQPYLAAALLPAGSHLAAAGELDRLRSVYRKSYRYLFLIGLPPFFFLAAHAKLIIFVWLGQENSQAATLLLLLTGGYAVNSLSNGMAFVCQGVGRPDIQARQSIIQLLFNIGLSLLFFRLIGPLGAAVGTSLALLIGAVIFVHHFHRHLEVNTLALLREAVLGPLLASMAAATASFIGLAGTMPIDRWSGLADLIWGALLFMVVFVGTCLGSGQITRQDLYRLRAVWLGRKGEMQ